MQKSIRSATFAVTAAAAMRATPVAAGDMDDLTKRGFRQVVNFASGDARYSIQWRAASHQCLQVITANGRIEPITDIQSQPKCR